MGMDQSMFVEHGDGLILPIGFRFKPTDEELLVHYLKRKVQSVPLPVSVIPEHQVFDTNPWDLPGELEETRYFFSKKKENVKNSSPRVQAGSGYWINIGRDKPVIVSQKQNRHKVVGLKRTSVFFQRNHHRHMMRTRWIMHQFFLLVSIANLTLTQNMMFETGDWFVSRIYQQKRRGARKNCAKNQESNRLKMIEMNMRRLLSNHNDKDSMMIVEEDNHENNSSGNSLDEEYSSPSCSSCSSRITEIFPSHNLVELDDESTSYGRYDIPVY